MIYFLDSTKVPFIISHAHHAHALIFLPYTFLSQSVLLGLRFIHKTFFFFFFFSFFLGGGGIVSPASPCSTIRGREVQPLAALYPTVRLSPWRQVRKNIHSRVWTPGPTWSVLHPGGPPLLVPLSSCTGGYGPHPWRLIRTPVQGGYPRYHSILSTPQEGFSTGPLTPRFKCFPATRILPTLFVCFLCGTWHRTLKPLPIGRVY